MLRKIMPHAAIILSLMYFVFFCIDRVNSAMAFINNDITKWLLVILCVISIYNAMRLIMADRRADQSGNRTQDDDASERAYPSKNGVARRFSNCDAQPKSYSASRSRHSESGRTADFENASRTGLNADRSGRNQTGYRRYR